MASKYADRWFNDEFNPEKSITEIKETLKNAPSKEEVSLTRKKLAELFNSNKH